MGWPKNTPELKSFYPNSTLVTGHDILFFWVARMIMMGEYVMKEVPFPETFLHGLIYGKSYWKDVPGGGIAYLSEKERQEYDLGKPLPKDVHTKWEKMSKTKGNVIDPLEIIDSYGTDAMRMALCASATQAREIDLDRRRFEEFKNFANKVWNGARFIFMNLDLTPQEFSQGLDESLLSLEDHWILSKLNITIKNVNAKLSAYTFDQAALEAYDFFWKEFCAYYLEIVKPTLFGKIGTPAERKNKQKLLVIILCQAIRLMHPMAPFITEELFQLLKTRLKGVTKTNKIDPYTAEAIIALQSPACIVAPYPSIIREKDINPQIDKDFDILERMIYAIRNIRGEMKIPPGIATDIHIISSSEQNFLKNHLNIISALVKTGVIELHHKEPSLGFTSTGMVDSFKIMIPLPEDMLKQEKTRLAKEQDRLAVSLEKLNAQMQNQEFTSKAPPQLIEKHKVLLEQTKRELAEIAAKLNKIG